jgi:hypothetical protein
VSSLKIKLKRKQIGRSSWLNGRSRSMKDAGNLYGYFNAMINGNQSISMQD